jgi:hypothetical protein
MIFMICAMGLCIFEEWLGQVDPRRPVHCALEVRPKKDMKTMVVNGMAPYPT